MYASLILLDRQDWINPRALAEFILASVDTETGGIADRPGDEADLFHTLFGVAAFSFVGSTLGGGGGADDSGACVFQKVDARYCMTTDVVGRVFSS